MKKVITYGTYDLLHKGHVRLLERAKALGDYLIVGVTADTFDRERGKINVQQSLVERIENVRSTGLADEIVIEEYEGQKIDDIKRMNVDIFTVGSDWRGKFDYLSEYCEVVYLERTKGISSTELRSDLREIRIGLVGESPIINKFVHESKRHKHQRCLHRKRPKIRQPAQCCTTVYQYLHRIARSFRCRLHHFAPRKALCTHKGSIAVGEARAMRVAHFAQQRRVERAQQHCRRAGTHLDGLYKNSLFYGVRPLMPACKEWENRQDILRRCHLHEPFALQHRE